MKVAVFVSYFPPHIGGVGIVAEDQVKELHYAGHEVEVVTSACNAEAGVSHDRGYSLRRIPAWNILEEWVGAAFPVFAPSLLWCSYMAVKRADVVHIHDSLYITSIIAAFWARCLNKPFVLTQHVDVSPHPNRLVGLVQQILYATTGRFVIKSSAKIIVLNARVEAFIASYGVSHNKISFLPNGVDTEIFKPVSVKEKMALRQKHKIPTDKQVVLFVGRFIDKKGFGELLDIPQIKDLVFVFAGGVASQNIMREDRFFMGKVYDRQHMAEIFQMSDFFVLPSKSEGFPVTVQEAMASGLSIAITDDPAYLPYKFDNKRILFIQPHTKDLIHILKYLSATDIPNLRCNAEYVRHYSEKYFNWDDNIKKLTRLYKEVTV